MSLLKCQLREFYMQDTVPPIDSNDANNVNQYSRTHGRGHSDTY